MSNRLQTNKGDHGFSLIELVIAMTITLVILGIATTLIARSLNVRTRANDNVDALADAERALNIMSREIAQSGFNLMPTDNGIVAGDSVTDANLNSTIRIRANLNKFDASKSDQARGGIGVQGQDSGEDIKYYIFTASGTALLARYDEYAPGGPASTVLANRLDALHVHYFAQKVTYGTNGCDITGASSLEVAPNLATYVVIAVCVQQTATGKPGDPGYQPAYPLLLTSDVALRNANLLNY